MIAIDASVVVKLFLPEAGTVPALALIESDQHLHAPDIIRVEVAAALVRAARNGRVSADDAMLDIQNWKENLETGAIKLHPAADDLEAAAVLALRLAHPLQDCLYLALAERLDVPLVTADMAFLTKASPRFPRVTPLVAP